MIGIGWFLVPALGACILLVVLALVLFQPSSKPRDEADEAFDRIRDIEFMLLACHWQGNEKAWEYWDAEWWKQQAIFKELKARRQPKQDGASA